MLGYRYLSKIKPKLKCPLKANTYNIDEVDMFFGMMLEMPVEGFRWIFKISFVGKPAKSKATNLMTIGCLIINARIMASSSRKRIVKPKDVILT